MLKPLQYWLLCALGILTILFVGVNIWLYLGNRSTQESVNARAQYLQQTGPIRDLYQQMANALAELAVKNKDEQLRGMLSEEGFTINPTPAQPGSAPPAGSQRGKP